jgi:hypothetical protein
VLGLVGSTGLATGPTYVIVSGKMDVQVDALRLKLPTEPMTEMQIK